MLRDKALLSKWDSYVISLPINTNIYSDQFVDAGCAQKFDLSYGVNSAIGQS